jgi:hypothetical protein
MRNRSLYHITATDSSAWKHLVSALQLHTRKPAFHLGTQLPPYQLDPNLTQAQLTVQQKRQSDSIRIKRKLRQAQLWVFPATIPISDKVNMPPRRTESISLTN